MQPFDSFLECTLVYQQKNHSNVLYIAIFRLSRFRIRLSKAEEFVTQFLCRQHLFSTSVAIMWHLQQIHHEVRFSGLEGLLSCGISGELSATKALASSKLPMLL